MSLTNQNDLDQLLEQFNKQNSLIESLEKELNSLKPSETKTDDANAELVKKLTTENDKLKNRINVLKTSIANAKSATNTNAPVSQSKY